MFGFLCKLWILFFPICLPLQAFQQLLMFETVWFSELLPVVISCFKFFALQMVLESYISPTECGRNSFQREKITFYNSLNAYFNGLFKSRLFEYKIINRSLCLICKKKQKITRQIILCFLIKTCYLKYLQKSVNNIFWVLICVVLSFIDNPRVQALLLSLFVCRNLRISGNSNLSVLNIVVSGNKK